MTLDDLWKLLKRYWAILLGCTLIGGALAALFVALQPKQYTASTSAYVIAGTSRNPQETDAASSAAFSNTMLAQQKAKAWVPMFTSASAANRVRQQLGISDVGAVKVTPVPDTSLLTIEVTNSSPNRARDVANALVKAASEEVKALEGGAAGARIELIAQAGLPKTPSYPNPYNIIPIGLLIGLAVGAGLTYLKARSDTRVRGQKDVEENLGTSVLAVVPKSKGLASKTREAEPQDFQTREALRKLRTNLRFIDPDSPPRAIVVTSSLMGEGKSSVASNLARVMAASGEKVLLIDADLRRPMIGSILEHENSVGLSQLIAGSVELNDVITPTEHRNLWTITAGQIPPNPSELLGSKRMKSLIDTLRKEYFVILDAPPLLPVTDAAVLLPSTDGALLVVEAERARREQLVSTRKTVETVNGHILGAVVNRANLPKAKKGKAYGQYGQYGAYGQYAAYGEYTQTPVVDDKAVAVPAESEIVEPKANRGSADLAGRGPVGQPDARLAPGRQAVAPSRDGRQVDETMVVPRAENYGVGAESAGSSAAAGAVELPSRRRRHGRRSE